MKLDAFKAMFAVAEKILQREIWALKAAYSVFDFFEVNVPKKVKGGGRSIEIRRL